MSARTDRIDLEPALGGWRLVDEGRVPGVTSRGAHIYLVHAEALAARDASRALAAAVELAAGASSMASAAALPASSTWRGGSALEAEREAASGRQVGTVGAGVSAVPTPQAPVGAVPRAAQALVAGHLSTGGSTSEQARTRAAERTTTREVEINHS